MDSVIDNEIPYLTTIWKTSIRTAVTDTAGFESSIHESILSHFTQRMKWIVSRLTSSLQSPSDSIDAGFPKFFLGLYLVYARSKQASVVSTSHFASLLDSLLCLGDASLPAHWIGLSSSQSTQLIDSIQSIVDNCIKSIVRLALQSQQTDVLLGVLNSSSSHPFSRFQMFLAIEQTTKGAAIPTILDAAQDAAFSLLMTSPQPMIDLIHSLFITLPTSQQADALHQICWAAVLGDKSMHRIVTRILQTLMSDGKITYTPHLQVPLSVEETSRGYLEFLLEYSFLLIAIQIRADVAPFQIVSISDIFGGCLRITSIDNQSKWIHFLLQGWESPNPTLSGIFGTILAGLEWKELK